jgi:photosystem II stability/assembly factor-like uncharacterized protein
MKKLILFYCLLFLCSIASQIYCQTITWTETQPAGNGGLRWVTSSMSSDGSKLIVGAYAGRLYISTNGGSSWNETQPAGNTNGYWTTVSLNSADGSIMIAGDGWYRLHISTNGGSSWTETQPAGNVDQGWRMSSMNSDGSKIIAGVNGGRLYISTNSGSSWTETQPAGNVDQGWRMSSMNSDGSKIIVGNGGRLYISTNSGSSWTETQPAGNTDKYWNTTSMNSDGSKLIAGAYAGRLYISTNGGNNWSEIRPNGEDVNKNWAASAMSPDGSKLIVGQNDGRLYVSSDGGSNWTETQPYGNQNANWWTTSMSSDGSKLIAGIGEYYGRLYLNNEPLPVEIITLKADFVNGKVNLNWQTATEVNNFGFEIERVITLRQAQSDNWQKIGFVAGHGNSNSPKDYSFVDSVPPCGSLSYRLKQIDTDGNYKYSDIVNVEIELPKEFVLEQNYPNPFNPTTTIRYSIPAVTLRQSRLCRDQGDNSVTLKVYDVLGNEVATLVDEYKNAGSYEVEFNVGQTISLSSGMYFYRLQAGSFVQTKKFILIK